MRGEAAERFDDGGSEGGESKKGHVKVLGGIADAVAS